MLSTLFVLGKEVREREDKTIIEILSSADVILGTTTVVSPDGPLRHLPKDHFDVCVIDEAGQTIEAACWTALLYAPKYEIIL